MSGIGRFLPYWYLCWNGCFSLGSGLLRCTTGRGISTPSGPFDKSDKVVGVTPLNVELFLLLP